MTKMENDKKEIIERIATAEREMSESFWKWSNILIVADAMGWSFPLDFDKKDLFSTLNIFSRVWINYAIKNGILTEGNVEEKTKMFAKAIEDCFGINTIKLTEEILNEKK